MFAKGFETESVKAFASEPTTEKMDREAEVKSLKRVAFLGVSISTIATLACVIAVPMLYSYMQRMQSNMQNEVDFCKSRSGNIWKEVTRTQVNDCQAHFKKKNLGSRRNLKLCRIWKGSQFFDKFRTKLENSLTGKC